MSVGRHSDTLGAVSQFGMGRVALYELWKIATKVMAFSSLPIAGVLSHRGFDVREMVHIEAMITEIHQANVSAAFPK
jgi:hypothetical protein